MRYLTTLLVAMLHASVAIGAEVVTPEQEAFFEKQVRPLLVAHCQKCHGAEMQEANLRLDSRRSMERGGDAGKVIVPGEPDRSRLIAAVRYDGELQMPPDYKLPAKDFQTLVEWVKIGAPWPVSADHAVPQGTDAALDPSESIAAARQSHWSYQPIRKPEIPAVGGEAWCRTPIDRFILAELEQRGLTPSPPADRRTLLRRLSFDLIGLPPTFAEVEAFVADESPTALEKVVDRLLASPHYGERWGRHWLDLARYADTKGYVFQEESRYPFAYTYRDYVVQSLNDDLPFDQFVLEQLAADKLPPRDDNRSLAAMGFLTVGRRFSNNIHDIIDDRIDVVTRGLLGLTVACARCHDHKYDPIPTADYYSLYAIFNSSTEPKELPLVGKPEATPAYEGYRQELAKLEAGLNDFVAQETDQLRSHWRSQTGNYLAHAVLEKLEKGAALDAFLADPPGDPRPQVVRRWRDYLARRGKQPDPVFGLWQRFVGFPPAEFAKKSAQLVEELKSSATQNEETLVNPWLAAAVIDQPPRSLLDVVKIYGQLFVRVDSEWSSALKNAADAKAAPLAALADPSRESLRQVLYGGDSPFAMSNDEATRQFDRATRNKHTALKKKIESLKASSPAAPPRAMVLNDVEKPTNVRIFLRGNPARPGPEVPRQYLALLAGEQRQPYTSGSGRLELARAIASPENPLTARVLVNRVWQQHFGLGLVSTPSDFGSRCQPPSHPELLDYLAATFMERGWSLKKLHREILRSSVFQQANADRPQGRQIDPENRLLWRANRRRLEFEPMRDALLAVSGQLDRSVGGRPAEISKPPYSTRRTLYGLIDRQDLPDMFRTFDFASPDVSTEQRPNTTVPQQALFAMNSPFVLDQARHLAARTANASGNSHVEPINELYRLTLARLPHAEEMAAAEEFIAAQSTATIEKGQLSPWEMLAQVLLLTNEFMFVD